VISIRDIIRGWNRFFFEPISPLPMAVYRILLGLLVLANQLLLLPDVMTWFSDRGALSFATARRVSGGSGLNVFNFLPHGDAMVWIVFVLSCFAAISLAAGFFTRTSAFLTFLFFVTLDHRNPVILNSGDAFRSQAVLPGSAAASFDAGSRLVGHFRGNPKPATTYFDDPYAWVHELPEAEQRIQKELIHEGELADRYFHALWRPWERFWIKETP